MIKTISNRELLNLGLFLFLAWGNIHQLMAQNDVLLVKITTYKEGELLERGIVEVMSEDSITKGYATDKNGKLHLYLKADHIYHFTFGGDEYVNKRLIIDTHQFEFKKGQPGTFDVEIDLFPREDGVDYSKLDNPIGIVKYNPKTKEFDASIKYDQ